MPRRFVALVPIPKSSSADVQKRRAEQIGSALAPVLAPESALGVLLSRALSSAQAVIDCNPRLLITQPLQIPSRSYATLTRLLKLAVAFGEDLIFQADQLVGRCHVTQCTVQARVVVMVHI
jgi:hypothetical protein